MKDSGHWYRSATEPPPVRVRPARAVRNWLRSLLPDPDVRGRTIVLGSRQTFPKLSWRGLRSEFHGLFSEFHSVLGALAYGEAHGASSVRVEFRSTLYVDADRGPNWWTYFFEPASMRLCASKDEGPDLRLNRIVTKFGRYGGFSDIVQGATPYLYPMTYGIARSTLHEMLSRHIRVRPEIRTEVDRFVSTRFEPGAHVVGVHYRGTDATRNWTGALTHYRTKPVPYAVYADEVRRVLKAAGPRRFQVFVATDEVEFLEFMQREFRNAVVEFEGSPRVAAAGTPVHLDRALGIPGYRKGVSVLLDCLVLASTNYLIKGRSNVSDAALAFNPDLPYSFCPDVPIG